ncbi:MAG: hypothetical protein AB8F34_15640 [Akkermansiaceae bacterium]
MSDFTILQKRAIFSVVAAIGVHGLVFASWISVIAMDFQVFEIPERQKKPKPEPEVVVVLKPIRETPVPPPVPLPDLPPEPKQPAPPKPPQPVAQNPPAQPPPSVAKAEEPKPVERKTPPEQKHRFARTSAEQEAKPDAPTDILGERDTRAASESAPLAGADPSKPSQDGAAPLHPGHVETVNKDHVDGSVGLDKTGPETETPQEATSKKDNTLIDDAPKVEESPKPDSEQSARPKDKDMKLGKPLPSTDDGSGRKQIEDKPKAEEAPKEKPNKGAKRDGEGEAVEQDPKKDGFSGFSRKTRVTGSISRRGKSSLNVRNSPLGRYQALVSKAVELQWRRNCEQHRDHIVPGVMSIRFYIDKKGKVSGIKFQEVIEGSYITRGFTQRAIRQAKIPRMPKSVLKELDGEPLELIYNFYF